MSTFIQKYWRNISKKVAGNTAVAQEESAPRLVEQRVTEIEMSPEDAFLQYLLSVPGPVEVDRLEIESPVLDSLKEAGVKVLVPLVSQGELIGLLNLGPRMSEQEYSSYDHRLLNNLATQAAPALRVAQLVRQQEAEARERERYEQELRVARVIQETLLPRQLPELPEWDVSVLWRPARAVSGDFYDFIKFPDGKLGIVAGDVTDKGVPAALVMASTRSILRSAAERLESPGVVLHRVNNLLVQDIPANMFVTCLYALLEPSTGRFVYANAGHNPPYKRRPDGDVMELRATGMPLGLMPEMIYEEKEAYIDPGEIVLIFSDGLIEAHNPLGEMFGFPRLREELSQNVIDRGLGEFLMGRLTEFTGPGWEQEDDVTFVSVGRLGGFEDHASIAHNDQTSQEGLTNLDAFEIPSVIGNEQIAMQRVAEQMNRLDMPDGCVERLKTAVAEAVMNAMEHGNHYQAEIPVKVQVAYTEAQVFIRIVDQGGDRPIPEEVAPDLDAKLAGLQSPRGWGLFLIRSMVDQVNVLTDAHHHTLELIMNR